jgi:hypothetical protein
MGKSCAGPDGDPTVWAAAPSTPTQSADVAAVAKASLLKKFRRSLNVDTREYTADMIAPLFFRAIPSNFNQAIWRSPPVVSLSLLVPACDYYSDFPAQGRAERRFALSNRDTNRSAGELLPKVKPVIALLRLNRA